MPTISASHLVLVIQAVDFKIADLEARIEALPDNEGSELESLLLDYDLAADALKQAYQEAAAQFSNLPPYEQLVRPEA